MEAMQVTLASQDDFFLATATGRVSVKEVLRVLKDVIDVNPRFEATCAPNPVTVGGLPTSATFG